jgi:hypothetical protein
MMSSWWFLWMAMMFLFLVPPMGYGWGYRGWGPPYPSYVQRRRAERAAGGAGPMSFDHQAWGVGGDLLWVVVIIGMVWAFSGLLWWR